MNNCTAYRVRPAGNDALGDPLGPAVRTALEGCSQAPRESSDVHDRGRQGVIVGLTLYMPPTTDLLHTDQVEVDGVLYDVEGVPGDWNSPLTGWHPGKVVNLTRAAG